MANGRESNYMIRWPMSNRFRHIYGAGVRNPAKGSGTAQCHTNRHSDV